MMLCISALSDAASAMVCSCFMMEWEVVVLVGFGWSFRVRS